MRRREIWETAVRVGSVVAVSALMQTLHNACVIRRPAAGALPDTEALTVLIPMRDEVVNVADCMDAVLDALGEWPGPASVVVLDDDSTDGTSEALADIATRDNRVRVVTGAPVPAGWLGKPWACHQLSSHVGHDGVMVFVDADVRVEPVAFVASVALLRETGLQLVSPYPRQEAHGHVERLVQPLLQWSWMSTLPLRLAERSARPSLSAANGQLLVADVAAYRRAGGHSSIRAEILEDIALLREVKRSGGRGVVVEGSEVASCTMYDGWRQVREGYRKSLWSAFGSLPGTIAVVALLNIAYVVPAVAMLGGSRVGFIGYLAGVASRVTVARTTAGRIWPDVLAHPWSILAFTALTADSVVAQRRGSLTWRGRSVAVGR